MGINLQLEKNINISENEILSELCEELAYHDCDVRNKFIMKLLKFAYIDHLGKPKFDKYVDVDLAESLLQELVYQLMKSWSSDKEMKKRFNKLYDLVLNIREENFSDFLNCDEI